MWEIHSHSVTYRIVLKLEKVLCYQECKKSLALAGLFLCVIAFDHNFGWSLNKENFCIFTFVSIRESCEKNRYEQIGSKRFQKKFHNSDLPGNFIDCYSSDFYCCRFGTAITEWYLD